MCNLKTEPWDVGLQGSCKFSVRTVWVSVQSLNHVWLFVTPQTIACQASLSITHSHSLLKLMSIESVMGSNQLILCRPLLLLPSIFPRIRIFSNESALHIRCKGIGVSASGSVLPMNIQDAHGENRTKYKFDTCAWSCFSRCSVARSLPTLCDLTTIPNQALLFSTISQFAQTHAR